MDDKEKKPEQEQPAQEQVPAAEEKPADAPKEEKLGAQVLRLLHEHAGMLMAEYDQYMNQLEEESVKRVLQKKLETLEGEMTQIEDVFAQAYGAEGYEPLEGAEDAAEETAGDSGEPEEPTPEEALQGMDKVREEEEARKEGKDELAGNKNLPVKAIKAAKACRKAMCPECGKDPCICKKGKADDARILKEGDRVEHEEQPGRIGTVVQDLGPGRNVHVRFDDTGETEPVSRYRVRFSKSLEDGKEATEQEQELGLQPHHVSAVRDARNFLEKVSQTQTLGEPERQEAYHHHRTLSQIPGDLRWLEGDVSRTSGAKSQPTKEKAKQILRDGEIRGEPLTKPQEGYFGLIAGGGHPTRAGKSISPDGVKAIATASGYFARLSLTKDFGQRHREEAAYHKAALEPVANDPVAQQDEEVNVNAGEKDDLLDSMETKDADDLKKSFLEQSKALEELNKKLESLVKV